MRLPEKIGHVYLRWHEALKRINRPLMATIVKKLLEWRVRRSQKTEQGRNRKETWTKKEESEQKIEVREEIQ